MIANIFEFLGAVLLGQMELPVSTTHTIVAGIIGFSLAAEGFESNRLECRRENLHQLVCIAFLYLSPFLYVLWTVKKVVLDVENTFDRAIKTFPSVIFIGVTINVAFILLNSQHKIEENKENKNYGVRVVLPACFGAGLLCFGLHFFR